MGFPFGDNSKNDTSMDDLKSQYFSVSDEEEDYEDSELKLVGELREMQNSFHLKLNKLEKNIKHKNQLKEFESIIDSNGDIEWANAAARVSNGKHPLGQSFHVGKKDPPNETESCCRELKRKLEFVTAELLQSRKEQTKKIKKATVREPMVIEVAEYPMEFYTQKVDVVEFDDKLENWFRRFSWHSKYQTGREYRQWVQTRTNEFFPKVLKVMTTAWTKIAPTTTQLVSSDLLTCRLVSKQWKLSVDKLNQERCQVLNSDYNDLASVSTKLSSADYKKLGHFLFHSSLQRFLKPHPFPSQSFIIKISPLDKPDYTKMFNLAINYLLRNYGTDIQHFGYYGHQSTENFFDDEEVPNPLSFNSWRVLKGWLEKMPNLKTVQISLPYQPNIMYCKEGSPDDNLIDPQLAFPRFHQLAAAECRHIPNFLMNSILNNNRGIEKLHYFQHSGEAHPKWTNMNEQLSKLSEFSLSALKIGHILPLRRVNWPLQKLTLSTHQMIYEEKIDLEVLFITLEHFQKTLQEVNLKLCVTCPNNDLRLELPQLKKMNLFLMESSKKKTSYDFLLPLYQLETLKLAFERQPPPDELDDMVQVIQLHGYLNHMYDSNIWKLFPFLKNLSTTSFYGDCQSAKEFRYFRDELQIH